jgi:hypothetical protein
MTRGGRQLAVLMVGVVLFALLLPGCSAFKGRKRPNLTPFAEHIISMSQDIRYGFGEEPTIWLNKYKDEPTVKPLLLEFRESAGSTRRVLRGVVVYSIEVVTIAQSRATGAEQANALADYVEHLIGPALEMSDVDLHITVAQFDSIIADMRGQNKIVDALNSAQPVVDEVARIVGEHIAQTETVLYQLNEALAAVIESEYAPQLAFRETIRERQALALNSLSLLLNYEAGNDAAYQELFDVDPVLVRGIPRDRKPTEQEVQTMVDRALLRFQRIDAVRQSVRTELEEYETRLLELHRLSLEAETAVRRARATALAWAQAHRKLASGVMDPAQIDMMGITQRVLGGIL